MKKFGIQSILFMLLMTARATAATKLSGTVFDENGVPVSGVQVTVKSASGVAQQAYTNDTGHFEVTVPAPGDYMVSLSKPDYFRLTDQRVPLQEETNEATFTLSHEFEVHTNVEVRSSTKQIEPLQPEHQETLDAQDILDIPTYSTHDLTAYLPMIAGVVKDNSGGIHVAGGRSGDSEYLLDGFEIGDPVSGQLTSRLNVDSVREAKVTDGRYGAQYAHAGGPCLNSTPMSATIAGGSEPRISSPLSISSKACTSEIGTRGSTSLVPCARAAPGSPTASASSTPSP